MVDMLRLVWPELRGQVGGITCLEGRAFCIYDDLVRVCLSVYVSCCLAACLLNAFVTARFLCSNLCDLLLCLPGGSFARHMFNVVVRLLVLRF